MINKRITFPPDLGMRAQAIHPTWRYDTMKRGMTVLVAATLLAACGDQTKVTGVDSPASTPPVAAPSGPGASPRLSGLIAVEDALERVMNGLPNGKAKHDMQRALESLAVVLDSGNAEGIRTARHAAEAALDQLGRQVSDEFGADVDALKLAVESID